MGVPIACPPSYRISPGVEARLDLVTRSYGRQGPDTGASLIKWLMTIFTSQMRASGTPNFPKIYSTFPLASLLLSGSSGAAARKLQNISVIKVMSTVCNSLLNGGGFVFPPERRACTDRQYLEFFTQCSYFSKYSNIFILFDRFLHWDELAHPNWGWQPLPTHCLPKHLHDSPL